MKKSSIREFYDRYYSALAGEPRSPPEPPNLQRYKERYKTMLLEQVVANLKPRSLVLDAGCGNGVNLFGVSASLSDNDLGVGVDVSRFQIREAVRYSKEFNVKSVDFVVGNITRLPFRSFNFDTVICTEVLEHLYRPRDALRELGDVMKPGGRLFVSTPSATDPFIVLTR